MQVAPRGLSESLGVLYARVLDRAIPRLRSTAHVNLAFAYPERNEAWRERLIDGVFASIGRMISAFAKFPQIEYGELIVDNACMQLVMRPETFDVLVLPNLYGDIVSDLAAGLVGGLGIVPGANMGETHAVFEAVHGSAPDIAGQGKANPTALMLSAVMMLTHMGENAASKKMQDAVEAVYIEGKYLTGDVGGTASTGEFADAVVKAIRG